MKVTFTRALLSCDTDQFYIVLEIYAVLSNSIIREIYNMTYLQSLDIRGKVNSNIINLRNLSRFDNYHGYCSSKLVYSSIPIEVVNYFATLKTPTNYLGFFNESIVKYIGNHSNLVKLNIVQVETITNFKCYCVSNLFLNRH